MSTQPKIIEKNTKEFDNLEKAVKLLSKAVTTIDFKIGTTYFDYGLDWLWTTIIAYKKRSNDSWQYLNPRDWSDIINAENSEDIKNAINKAIAINKNLN